MPNILRVNLGHATLLKNFYSARSISKDEACTKFEVRHSSSFENMFDRNYAKNSRGHVT